MWLSMALGNSAYTPGSASSLLSCIFYHHTTRFDSLTGRKLRSVASWRIRPGTSADRSLRPNERSVPDGPHWLDGRLQLIIAFFWCQGVVPFILD